MAKERYNARFEIEVSDANENHTKTKKRMGKKQAYREKTKTNFTWLLQFNENPEII